MNKYQRKRAQFIKKCRRVEDVDRKNAESLLKKGLFRAVIDLFSSKKNPLDDYGVKYGDELMTLRLANVSVMTGKHSNVKKFYDENFKNRRK